MDHGQPDNVSLLLQAHEIGRLTSRVIIEDDIKISVHVCLSYLPLDRVFPTYAILPVALLG